MSAPRVAGPAAYQASWLDTRARLQAWRPPDPGQAALRAQFLKALEYGPAVLSRQGPPAHITAGVVVLDPGRSSVLLTHHRKAGAWFQFGGHVEADDPDVAAAALREGIEESGLRGLALFPDIVHLDRHALPGTFGSCREHLDIRFAALAPRAVRPVVSHESLDVRWWPIDALPPGSAADLGPLIRAAVCALAGPRLAPGSSPGRGTGEDTAPPMDSPMRGGA